MVGESVGTAARAASFSEAIGDKWEFNTASRLLIFSSLIYNPVNLVLHRLSKRSPLDSSSSQYGIATTAPSVHFSSRGKLTGSGYRCPNSLVNPTQLKRIEFGWILSLCAWISLYFKYVHKKYFNRLETTSHKVKIIILNFLSHLVWTYIKRVYILNLIKKKIIFSR